MLYILIAAIGYFLGNISSSYLVGKLGKDVDVREHGSGNLGTTNAFRVLGLKGGTIVFFGDILKGVLAALIGRWIKGDIGALVGGAAAVAGHDWPFMLGFRGGKGIATSFGAVLVLYPKIGLILFAVEVLVVLISGYVSLASITSAVLFPILVIAFGKGPKDIIWALAIGLLAIFRHRSNITRLRQGTENKVLKGNRVNKLK